MRGRGQQRDSSVPAGLDVRPSGVDVAREDDLYERLQSIATTLALALTEADVVRTVVDGGAAALGLKNAAFWRVVGDELVMTRSVGYGPFLRDIYARVPLATSNALADCVRNRAAGWFESRDAYADAYPAQERATRPEDGSDVAFACLPLVLDGAAIGAVTFAFAHAHRFEPDERRFLSLLAAQCAHALARATLLERLAASEQRYRLMIDNAHEGVWLADASRRTTFVNRRVTELLGYAAEEMLGRPFTELMSPEGRAGAAEREERRRRGESETFDCAMRHKDGRVVWVMISTSPLFTQGAYAGSLALLSDITARKRNETNHGFLTKSAEILTAELHYERTLARLAELAVPAIADWCAVDLVEGDRIRRIAVVHRNRERIALAHELTRRYPMRRGDGTPIATAIEQGETRWAARVPEEVLRRTACDDEHFAILKALGVVSSIVVPLVAEGECVGAVSFVTDESGRVYDETDKALAEELARRAGAAISNARMFAREQRARERIASLQALTAALARADSAEEVARVATREGARALGGSVGLLYSVNGRITLVAQHGTPDDFIETMRTIPRDSPLPVARVARERTAVWIESFDDFDAQFTALAARARDRGRSRAFTCAPLMVRDDVVGVLSYGFADDHVFDPEDRAFILTVADHCAQAFDRARLRDAQRRASERLALLARAGETFSSWIDYDTTLRNVVALALPALGDYGFFDIKEGSEVRRIADAYDDPETARFFNATRWEPATSMDVDVCALSTGRPGYHPDIDDAWMRAAARSEEHLAEMRRRGLCSLITVPLRSRGEVIGALTLSFARSRRRHTKEDLDLAMELARRAAIAIEQARLYRAAQEAARHAEEANRIKDEFLATVSHELRTPLNAIAGWASLLSQKKDDAASVAKGLEVIKRNAQAQTKLVEDILDVSRIVTGKLKIDPRPVDAVAIVREAIDVVRPSADARKIAIGLECGEAPCLLVGDPERLQQVVWNLLSNAVKFSDAGGSVNVRVAQEGPEVVVTVSDRGRGIAADFLPHVFERFKQADGSTTRKVGGLGLGLAIVKHIVELHGGRVEARSVGLGQGATFRVVLPVRALAPPRVPEDRPSSPRVGFPAVRDLRGVRVLVVDDEADARELVEAVLAEEGAIIETASSAEETMAALERFQPDVLVSDIGLPETDGYALIQQIRALPRGRGGAVPAVALTAFARADDRIRALTSGFNVHVPKPVEPRELVTVVGNLANVAVR